MAAVATLGLLSIASSSVRWGRDIACTRVIAGRPLAPIEVGDLAEDAARTCVCEGMRPSRTR